MNVQVEASSIVERLKKLRQWQLEQHEKLMKQQQIQREILNHEQDLIYKALSLSVHDISDTVENTKDIPVIHRADTKEALLEAVLLEKAMQMFDSTDKMIEEEEPMNENDAVYENYKEEDTKELVHVAAAAATADSSRNSIKSFCSGILSQREELSDDLLIEGVKPLSQDNMVPSKCISFDDIPLPSPKKDFKTLLEEKLRREPAGMQNDTKTQTKRPFLKKGKGLSRFKININPAATTTRKCALSSSAPQRTSKSNKNTKSVPQKDSSSSSNAPTANKTRRLNLKTVPLPRSKTAVKSKPITPAEQNACSTVSDRPAHLPEMNASDVDSKAERELEEVRIFELLEEKAENSSFCSTSSTVLAFLQQSTPFKVRKGSSRAAHESDIATSTKRQSGTVERQSTTRRPVRVENAKSGARIEQSGAHKRSRISVATVDSYWDTVVSDDIPNEEQRCSVMVDQASQSEEMDKNYLEDRAMRCDTSCDARIVMLSSSDEDNDIPVKNNRNLAHGGEAEMNHRVRFAEYNEYRTIDLTDVSDATSKSPLRDYLEQEDWHDRSGSISESSDVEESHVIYKESTALRTIGDNGAIVPSGRLFPQQNVAKDSYYRVMTSLSIPEEDNALNDNEESAGENNEEEIDQTSDEEIHRRKEEDEERQSVLSSLSSSSLSDAQGPEYVLRNNPEELTDKVVQVCPSSRDVGHSPSENRTGQASTFEPELLKSRLLELEREIDIFRKESSALVLQRRKLQEEHAVLRKEYAEKEKTFEENRRRMQNQLEEEKKRLTRERAAMENRIRDAQEKARQNKVERHRAQSLQEELEQLRDELGTKESRWHAAESRYKSEIRALRVDNAKLKQEVASLQNVRKTNLKNIRRSTVHGQVITRSIGQINKRLTAISAKENSMKAPPRNSSDDCACDNIRKDEDRKEDEEENEEDEDEDGRESAEPIITQTIDVNNDLEPVDDVLAKMESKQIGIGSESSKCNEKSMKEDIARKKRHLYKTLINDVMSDFAGGQGVPHVTQGANDLRESLAAQMENSSPRSNRASGKSSDKSTAMNEDLCIGKNAECSSVKRTREARSQSPDEDGTGTQARESSEEKRNSNPASSYLSSRRPQPAGVSTKETVKQIQFADGRVEYWYPNGNVKKIFPEQGVTKMIYYNGDVRETNKDGRVKYFYATTCTWHITTPDGMEILEFSKYV